VAQRCTYLLELIPCRHASIRRAVAFTVVSLATLDVMAVPFGMAPVAPHQVDRWLAAQPGTFPFMEYPIPEHACGCPEMYSTRFHR